MKGMKNFFSNLMKTTYEKVLKIFFIKNDVLKYIKTQSLTT